MNLYKVQLIDGTSTTSIYEIMAEQLYTLSSNEVRIYEFNRMGPQKFLVNVAKLPADKTAILSVMYDLTQEQIDNYLKLEKRSFHSIK